MNKGESSGIYDRCLEKTPEQLFIGTLRREFELSPAASLGILEAAKEHLFGPLPETAGKIRFICASREAKHGKPLFEQDKVRVELTLDGGIEDLDVARTQGIQVLRQYRILRLTQEAYDQGGLLTQEDLSRLLHVSSRTIRNDMKELVEDGNTVHTRGYDHDIGSAVSHKTRIIDLYLQGYTYAEIMRRTRHSGHSVKRYVLGFGRLLLLKSRGVDDVTQLSHLLSQSRKLTEEYLEVFQEYLDGDQWPRVYVDLLEQLRALYPSKRVEKKGGMQSP
jgi:biotin operon repressor